MTKKTFLITLTLIGFLIPFVCFLGYFGFIQNGMIISRIVKVLLVCILAMVALFILKFRRFDKMLYIAIGAAAACAFILVVH